MWDFCPFCYIIRSMKKLVGISIIFILTLIIFGAVMTGVIYSYNEKQAQMRDEKTVTENELRQLISSGDTEGALSVLDDFGLEVETASNEMLRTEITAIWVLIGICIIAIIMVVIYVYVRILRPFEKLKEYAGEVSKGNLDIPVTVDRGNYFGDFTWLSRITKP